MAKINFSRAFVANTVTSLNIFCGFLSIVYCSEGDFRLASIMIVAAAVFDMLDGIIARLMGTASRFGVELDSLSDVVSFGAAPAFLIYKAHMYQYGFLGVALSSCLMVFGALRLARFNIQIVDLHETGDFKGLPIPVSAITIALLVMSFHKDNYIIKPFDLFVIPLIIILSLLMVSHIRYNALPKLRDKNLKWKIYLFAVLLIALILSILTNGEILFYIFFGIVVFGILRYLFNLVVKKKIN